MRALPSLAFWLIAGSVLAGSAPALAQAAVSPGAMPPPPSSRDALPLSTSEPSRPGAAKPRRPADAAGREQPKRPARAQAQEVREPPLRERIDTRPARQERTGGAFQLEDDPRAVSPVIQNGRAGVGMRF